MTHPLPTDQKVHDYLFKRRNWGRWGDADQRGAVNLITPEKRREAAALVRSGSVVSLSRTVPKAPAPDNFHPPVHGMFVRPQPNGVAGASLDYFGSHTHGMANTHLDALCHMWDSDGMWNGRDAKREITFDGAQWGAVHHWGDEGIITRGVLLDVPRHRGQPFVAQEEPVHGWELEEIAAAQGTPVRAGDALCVYSGRDAWQRANPGRAYGMSRARPGLHPSCLPFLRDHDVSALLWDMLDLLPHGYSVPFTVHGAIWAYGIALIDNAALEPLAAACAAAGRYEFLLTIAPLKIEGGTGCPVNPLAVL
ncbi:MAG: cyclase family protein [Dehalococcoidia bacterium]|nr:cyclase family protein [Dehalococcoidia bacterium]